MPVKAKIYSFGKVIKISELTRKRRQLQMNLLYLSTYPNAPGDP